jgi:hypothetical protein
MANSYLWQLIEMASRIIQLDELESEIADKREWQRGKDEWEALQGQFDTVSAEYVAALYGDDAPGDHVPDDVQRELTSLREEADPSWYPAIDYTEEKLMPLVIKEAGKSPRMRKARRAAPIVAIAVTLVVYFGIALFSGTPVTKPIETREGIRQRAAATEKVIRYDEWAGTRVRKGAWLKAVLLWPIEPDPYEIKGAGEFASLVLEGQRRVPQCELKTGYDTRLADAQIKLIGEVASIIQSDDLQWEEPSPMTVVSAIEKAESCQS